MPVPFLGRLNSSEYVALIGSFFLVGLETFIRIFTLALPSSLLDLLYRISRRLFNRLTSPAQKRAEERRKSISESVRNASDFVDLCAMFGYTAEEHVVQTKDGYLLGLHRLAWRKGEEETMVNRGPNSIKKRVVYLHHGLLMNSEVWVCLTDAQRALPFVLVDRGFDVWLGNNRGNKYSKKSVHCSPTSLGFWNFSIDEFAFHDIPDSIAYILDTTGQKSLSYIGFSQGTAQAFASLAVHPKLNDQVNVFIALAPAMSPAGLHNGIVDALVKASPQVLFLLFGRRSILSSATMWQSILYPPLFTKVIDIGLGFLFNWRTENISTSQKLAAYPHLYSFTSTKSVVHWFQIIRTKSFQMYDDDVHPPLLLSTTSKHTKVAKYPTRNIKTPIVLVYGGSDSLVDIRVMLRELPSQTVANEIPHYEHLDFLWARDVDSQVFQHVFDALESFTGAEHTKEEYERYRSARHTSMSQSAKPSFRRHTHRNSDVAADSDVSTALGGGSSADNETLVELLEQVEQAEHTSERDIAITERSIGAEIGGGPGPSVSPLVPDVDRHPQPPSSPPPQSQPQPQQARESQIPTPSGGYRLAKPRGLRTEGGADNGSGRPVTPASPSPPPGASRVQEARPCDRALSRPTSRDGMQDLEHEDLGLVDESASSAKARKRRSTGASHASQISSDSMKGGRGIVFGASKAVGGVTTGAAEIANLGSSGIRSPEKGSDSGKGPLRRKK
ncbi:Alpha/Beta hydrolase protein [Diplogelasinospora grovesii]|uniref:Alpha/Beta hydrolase protein n=1 Tax=Diplogelasinospora grovesii TaxID=303347 RepID=A0AAN6S7Y1_9PEZI|nr:Alpha/Beta hydrolase protein [Diplogelasinospora grovesii]